MPDPGGKEIQYWDAVLFTSFLTETIPERVDSFRQLLRQVEMRLAHARAVASTLVIAEVRPYDTDNPAHKQLVEDLFDADRPYLQFFAVSRRVAMLARQLATQYDGLTNPDAIHLATALIAGADVFLTYDGARDNKNRRSGKLLRLDGQLGSPPLKIRTPEMELAPLLAALAQPPPQLPPPPLALEPPASPPPL
jgi:predicted nucleic acid-binding protein